MSKKQTETRLRVQIKSLSFLDQRRFNTLPDSKKTKVKGARCLRVTVTT